MAYDPKKPGIPTLYNGIQFRSRLEAKWAAFFDLVGWKYQYEPFDLNGWIPDFLIMGRKRSILVEVKPVELLELPEDVSSEMEAATLPDDDYDLLIVGPTISVHGAYYPECFGWEREPGFVWSYAMFGRWEDRLKIGYCSSSQSFRDRISEQYDGGACGGAGNFRLDDVHDSWKIAGNMTQWKGKRSVVS